MPDNVELNYSTVGVDLDAADKAKKLLKSLLDSNRDENTISNLGLFGGLYSIPEGIKNPVLVSSADGVGTKLKVAFLTGRHDTVGQDLVNHCVNDILSQGARPLFFLDYIASGAMDEIVVTEIVTGLVQACKENKCVLLGGETAQMPGFYSPTEYDLAGFIVGIVEREKIIDGSRVGAGNVLIGIESSGLHTNGYTLARNIVFDVMNLTIDDLFPDSKRSVSEVLLDVHLSYLNSVSPILETGMINALAHITGGGIPGNLPRVLGPNLCAKIDPISWDVPNVFRVIQDAGKIEFDEMVRVFNMGVGMVAVVSPKDVEGVMSMLRSGGLSSWVMGEVEIGEGLIWA